MNRFATTTSKRLRIALPVALLAGSIAVQPARAQDAQKCNEEIGKQVRGIGKTAASGQDKCHGIANKVGVSGGICNDVTTAAYTILDGGKYIGTEGKATTKLHDAVTGKCPAVPAATVLDRLPGDNLSNKYASIDELVTDRGTVLLGEEDFDGDPVKIKCFKTISSVRRAVTDKMINTVNACQKTNPPANSLNLASCLADTALNGMVKGKDTAIKVACVDQGLTGDDVGSCDPLFSGNCSVTTATLCNQNSDCPGMETCVTDGTPGKRGCVSQAAIAEGKNLATIAYPAETCNGVPVVDARTVGVTVNTPTDLAGITVKVKYPSFDAGLGENGANISIGSWTYSVALLDAFDLDDAVRISAADLGGISSGSLVTMKMDVCRPLQPQRCELVTTRSCTSNSQCTAGSINATCTARGIPHDCCSGAGAGCVSGGACSNIDGKCSVTTSQLCTDEAQCRATACANNAYCTAAGNPFNCCTGSGTGNCDNCLPRVCQGANTKICQLDTECTAAAINATCTMAGVPHACCTGGGTGTCVTGDCLSQETCIAQGRSCSLSKHIQCDSNSDCPATEFCASQKALTTCEVEAAADTSGNPVDGVTCSTTVTEP